MRCGGARLGWGQCAGQDFTRSKVRADLVDQFCQQQRLADRTWQDVGRTEGMGLNDGKSIFSVDQEHAFAYLAQLSGCSFQRRNVFGETKIRRFHCREVPCWQAIPT